MESPVLSPPYHHHHPSNASRPSLGFPLGTALLLIIIFSLSGIFSCCYHWDKLRFLRRSFSNFPDSPDDLEASPSKPRPPPTELKQNQRQSIPVLMPGDHLPKFIALPCPCEPPREEKVAVEVEKPAKPPRLADPLC